MIQLSYKATWPQIDYTLHIEAAKLRMGPRWLLATQIQRKEKPK